MADEEPLLRVVRVVRGTPTPEELAALVGAIFLRHRPATSARAAAVSTWARRSRPGTVSPSGMPAHVGRDAWRVSGLPH
ncbi:acyl-CoA carboxylase subunit epsilon [Plantactinospora mayteni]|uniref:acyl-CoA carboxylase subunit epsilon n=1 Tax=Plantactinospora mayteni TaxID=566021 RepID=UPI001941A1D2|nr:acyl-CoA carboxylase subunit epsilon [Plantactinospora mayteni]